MTTISLDLDSLTFREVIDIEDIAGEPIDALGDPGSKKGRMMLAAAYIALRRDDPEITLEDVEAMQMAETVGLGEEAEAAPLDDTDGPA